MGDKYSFLENVAISDIAFEAYGRELNDLFINAAKALFDSMAETDTVDPVEKRTINFQNEKIEDLLFDFLSEIVFLKDRDGMVFCETDLEIDKNNDTYILSATIYGDHVNPEKQKLGADVKAVTFHMFKVEKTKDGYKATVVLDV